MPLNRSQLMRITTIDRCLSNHYRKWTLQDLIDACSDALYEFEGRDEPVSRRTIQNDIALMRSEKLGYNAPIVVKDRKYYAYEDPDFSIKDIPITDDDITTLNQAMDVLKHFQIFSQFSPFSDIINRLEDHISVVTKHNVPAIDLEKNNRLKGLEYVSELYDAITHKEALHIEYKSFKRRDGTPSEMIISPYLLKEYRNRWFVICNNARTKNDISILALDRIYSLEHDKSLPFVENTFFDPIHFFDDVIGVTKSIHSKPVTITLKFDANQAPYVITKPMHSSQVVTKVYDDHSIEVKIHVVMNLELERDIIGYAEHCEVISPRMLRKRISDHFRQSAAIYTSQEEDK